MGLVSTPLHYMELVGRDHLLFFEGASITAQCLAHGGCLMYILLAEG